MGEVQNDGVVVAAVEFHQGGIVLTCAFPTEERKGLERQHTFALAYDQESYGAEATRIREDLEDLAYDLLHNYTRQPKVGD